MVDGRAVMDVETDRLLVQWVLVRGKRVVVGRWVVEEIVRALLVLDHTPIVVSVNSEIGDVSRTGVLLGTVGGVGVSNWNGVVV